MVIDVNTTYPTKQNQKLLQLHLGLNVAQVTKAMSILLQCTRT